MKTDFGEVGVEEDVLGVDQVEVYFLEGGGNGGATGLVKIDLETISKLVFQLVRKQATELPSRTFGGLKGPNVIFSLTTMGSDVEVNNSRSDGFCLKMRRQEENRQNEEIDRTITLRSGEEERGQWARAIDGGSEREPRRATQDSQGDHGHNGRRLHLRPRVPPEGGLVGRTSSQHCLAQAAQPFHARPRTLSEFS